MSNRITKADLESLVDRINHALGYVKDSTPAQGYFIYHAYGNCRLALKMETGMRDISPLATKRETYRACSAYLDGIVAGKMHKEGGTQ